MLMWPPYAAECIFAWPQYSRRKIYKAIAGPQGDMQREVDNGPLVSVKPFSLAFHKMDEAFNDDNDKKIFQTSAHLIY